MAYDYDGSTDVETLTERASNPSAPSSNRWNAYFTPGGWVFQDDVGIENFVSPVNAKAMVSGRLTLTTGTPITTSDVLAATTLYYTPYIGNQIALYDSTFTCWRAYTFTERSLSLSGLAAGTPRDIFIYDNAGTLTLESVAWTNDTTRATALARQDEIYVQSGNVHKRYLGTIRTTATIGQCEDSVSHRYVWNYYHRLERRLYLQDLTGHSYSSGTFREWNAGTFRVHLIVGAVEEIIKVTSGGRCYANGYINAGLNVTNAGISLFQVGTADTTNSVDGSAPASTYPALGYNFVALIEAGAATPAQFVAGAIETIVRG